MLKIININKEYLTKNKKIIACNNINIELPNNGLYSIIGKSGAGKTTILNCIAGIDRVTSGEIYYNNIDITKLKGKKLDSYRKQIGFIFQDYNLLSDYTVEENIALPMSIEGYSKKYIQNQINNTLKKVGLEGYNERKITELSGGEQQRVVIARALAKNAKMILCDEPTGNLDEENSRSIFQILKDISKSILVIVVSHNNILAEEYSNGIIEIQDGSVVFNSIKNIDNELSNPNMIKTKFKSWSIYFKLCFEHLGSLLKVSLMVLLLFICTYSFFNIFYSVSKFDETDALIETLKKNDQTVVNITSYEDYVIEENTENGKEYKYGVNITSELNPDEINTMKNTFKDKADVYNIYNYYKSFDTFSEIDYPFELNYSGDDFIFHYHAFNFEKMIAVNDFTNFSMPILYGSIPNNDYEILIYDYMADNLIYHKVFNGKIKDIIGKSLKDNAQNFELKIVGIIKSNYKNYEYTDGLSTVTGSYGISYLTSLKNIFVSSNLLEKMKNTNSVSIAGITLNKELNDKETKQHFNNFNKIESLNSDNYEYVCSNKNTSKSFFTITNGYILTISQVSYFLGLDRRPTEEEMNDFIAYGLIASDKPRYELKFNLFSNSDILNPSFYSCYSFSIYGIVEDEVFSGEENTIHLYSEIDRTDGSTSSSICISLNKDYSNAYEVLSSLQYPYHNEDYYEKCIKDKTFYNKKGFCIYDFSDLLISKASEYLYDASNISKYFSIVCLGLLIFSIASFCTLSIKKEIYKIGILKSLGTRNSQICLSYILSISIISIISYLISIIVSILSMNFINQAFSKTIENSNLVLFSLSNDVLLVTFGISLIVILLTSVISYLIFTINPPVMLIRNNKER